MGSGRWDSDEWKGHTTTRGYTTKTTAEIFEADKIDKDLNPMGVKIRESRDSKDNPESTAIIVGLDVSGSMHIVLDVIARQGLNTLCTEIYNRKPVTDPHIMAMAIGDAEAGDRAPLQVTQFEADIRIAKQLEKIWLEGGGGGNHYESYILPWYFAAMHTEIDCFEKRGKKGYLFTIGDEEATPYLRAEDVKRVLGTKPQSDITANELLKMVTKQWEVFHIMIEEGDYMGRHKKLVTDSWTKLLGQRAIKLSDHKKLGEVIVSAIQVNEGADAKTISKTWDGGTAIVVSNALKDLKGGSGKTTGTVVRF